MTIDKVLHEMGFERFVIEHGIYVVGEGDERMFMALYVDVVPSSCQSGMDRVPI